MKKSVKPALRKAKAPEKKAKTVIVNPKKIVKKPTCKKK